MAGLIRIYRTPPVQCLVKSAADYEWSLAQALEADPHDIRSVLQQDGEAGITELRTNRLAGELTTRYRAWPEKEN